MSDETRFFALMLQLVQSIPDGSALRWCFDPDIYLRAALEALLESEAIGAAASSVFADAASNTPMEVITVGAALVRIHSQQYASRVERLRALLASKGPEAYDRAKKALTAVTFGGTFAPTRAAANLVQHSGVVHGDIDHVLDPHTLKKALCADPRTLYCFISPSGSGIKLGTRVEPVSPDRAYKHAWTIVAQEYERQYGAGELTGMAGGHMNGKAGLEGTMLAPALFSGRVAGGWAAYEAGYGKGFASKADRR